MAKRFWADTLSDVLSALAVSLAWLGVLRWALPPARDAGVSKEGMPQHRNAPAVVAELATAC